MVYDSVNRILLKKKTILMITFVAFAALGLLFFSKVVKEDVKSVPIVMITNFEERYSKNYELVDSITFNLSQDNPTEFYESKDGENLVFSFTDTDNPINFTLVVEDEVGKYSGGFTADNAIKVDFDSKTPYRFEYSLGYQEALAENKNKSERNKAYVDFACGKVNVYKVK